MEKSIMEKSIMEKTIENITTVEKTAIGTIVDLCKNNNFAYGCFFYGLLFTLTDE